MARRKQAERIPIHTSLYAKKDMQLLQEIWNLQAKRIYMKTFRDAFRLILSLRKKDTSVLFELFPWIQSEPVNRTQLNYINYLIECVRELEDKQSASVGDRR